PATIPVFGPATHTVVFNRDGYLPESRSVSIRAGESLKIDAALREVPAPPPIAHVKPYEPPRPERPRFIAQPGPVESHPGRAPKIAGAIALAIALAGAGVAI